MGTGRSAVLAILVMPVLIAASRGEGSDPRIEDLVFMTGHWTCDVWGGTFEEIWTMPAAGTMQGLGRHVAGGKTTFMEFLSIEPTQGGGLTMWIILGAPSKGDKKPVPFKLTSAANGVAVFENSGNDFPSKITYRASGKEKRKLLCRIEGVQNGKREHTDFEFHAIGP